VGVLLVQLSRQYKPLGAAIELRDLLAVNMRDRGPGFREVLGVREFRALWAAELFSILGDQLARVALAILVYHRTSSAALSALTYALTFAPAIIGGALLSGLADRYPRRRVLIVTDLLRAALAAAMAIPALPLPALWVLVGLLSMSSAPFKAAQLALLPSILEGDRYITGLSLRQMTGQSAQLVGFASGGLLLAAVEPHVALAGNAVTFLISAGLIVTGVRTRPAAAQSKTDEVAASSPPVTERGTLLPVFTLVCLAGLFVVPEGIAAPYGSAIGAGATGVGLLMAADPLGSVIGAWLIARIRIAVSPPAIVALAAASGVPLIVCAPGPGLAISIALWALSGALSTAYLIHCQAMVVTLVPDHRRGRVMGRLATCLYASSGLAIVGGGVAAEVSGPFRSVAAAGLLGTVIALCVGVWWRRVARSRRDLVAGSEPNSTGEVVGSQSSLFAMTDASSQVRTEWVFHGEISHQSSLFAMTGTSSSHSWSETVFQTPAHQSSLFITTSTSSSTRPETDHLGKTRLQSSLLDMSASSPTCSESNPGKAHFQSSLFDMCDTSSFTCSESSPEKTRVQSSLFITTGTSSPTCSENSSGKTGPQSSLFATTGTSSRATTWDDSAEKTGLQSSLFATRDTSPFVRNAHVYPPEIRVQSSLFDTSGTSSSQLRDESDSKQDRAHQSSLFVTTGTSSQADSRDGRGFPVAVHRLRDRVLTQAPSLWGWLCKATGARLVFERG
jgi:MFS family permease